MPTSCENFAKIGWAVQEIWRKQYFAISKCTIFWPHTRLFIYRSIFLKFSGFLGNTLNRQWVDFEHDRNFTFQVIEVLKLSLFSRFFNFTREYLTKVAKSHLPRSHSHCPPMVQISSKSAQPFSRYDGGHTDKHTNTQTHRQTKWLTGKVKGRSA